MVELWLQLDPLRVHLHEVQVLRQQQMITTQILTHSVNAPDLVRIQHFRGGRVCLWNQNIVKKRAQLIVDYFEVGSDTKSHR